jgi:hypothetical protein
MRLISVGLLGSVVGVGLALGCSSSSSPTQPSPADAVKTAVASDPGAEVASVPATTNCGGNCNGVAVWNVYVQASTPEGFTVQGADNNGQVLVYAVIVPDQGVLGVGTPGGGASEAAARAIASAMASDINGFNTATYAGQTSGMSANMVHPLTNKPSFDCVYFSLLTVGSFVGAGLGAASAFAACPETLGATCVAGVWMAASGVTTGTINATKAYGACKGPTTLVACQTACGNIGARYPTCLSQSVLSGCYSDCSCEQSATVQAVFAGCINLQLNSASKNSPSDPCSWLLPCFKPYGTQTDAGASDAAADGSLLNPGDASLTCGDGGMLSH